MLPVIAIVGRPNVGKSTLYNYLTKTRDALVSDMPGLTRDRQYGKAHIGGRDCIVIDTGGLSEPDNPQMAELTDTQVVRAIEAADVILFMVDARSGLVSADKAVAHQLRRQCVTQKVVVVVNKADRLSGDVVVGDFYGLGFGEPVAIAAAQGRGVNGLLDAVLADFPEASAALEFDETAALSPAEKPIKVALIGRPNVGKSTLTNRMLGEERVVVSDVPGTTRDSIFVPFKRRGKDYILIDTAGLRRRARVKDAIEKFSVVKSIQAMRIADVVLLLLDATAGITEQDKRLIGLACEAGKALLIVINKWDAVTDEAREAVRESMARHFAFVDFARRYCISAQHGTGVGDLYRAIEEAHRSAWSEMPTTALTEVLMRAQQVHQPPLVKGRRIKLRYAHVGSRNPLCLVIHGKQTQRLPVSYQRYLSNYFREAFKLVGVPLYLRFKSDDNPYDR